MNRHNATVPFFRGTAKEGRRHSVTAAPWSFHQFFFCRGAIASVLFCILFFILFASFREIERERQRPINPWERRGWRLFVVLTFSRRSKNCLIGVFYFMQINVQNAKKT